MPYNMYIESLNVRSKYIVNKSRSLSSHNDYHSLNKNKNTWLPDIYKKCLVAVTFFYIYIYMQKQKKTFFDCRLICWKLSILGEVQVVYTQ